MIENASRTQARRHLGDGREVLDQQGAEPQRGGWIGPMQGRIGQRHSICMHDGPQHHGGCRGEKERRNGGQAGIVRRCRRPSTVLSAARIHTVLMCGGHLCRGTHAHTRTVPRHGDICRRGGQGASVGRHGQLLEQQTEQRDTGPKDSATTADVKAFAHGVTIIAQLDKGPVKHASSVELPFLSLAPL